MKLTIELGQEEMTQENLALIGQLTGVKVPEIKEEKKTVKKEDKPVKAGEKTNEEEVETVEEKTTHITLEDVKALGVELSRSGKKDEVKEIIKSFGAKTLSEIPEEKYGEVTDKLNELKD